MAVVGTGQVDSTWFLTSLTGFEKVTYRTPAISPEGNLLARIPFGVPERLVLEEPARDPVEQFPRSTLRERAGVPLPAAEGYFPAFSPTGDRLVVRSATSDLRLYDGKTLEGLWATRGVGSPGVGQYLTHGPVVAFGPSGRILASGERGTVRLLDAATGLELWRSARHDAAVSAVAFSPDGKTLATGMVNGTILLWDVAREAR